LKKQKNKLSEELNAKDGPTQYKNYVVVLSTIEDIELTGSELIISYRTPDGISRTIRIPFNVDAIAPYQKELRLAFRPLKNYTHSITVNDPEGKKIIYSYDKNTRRETFDNSQSPAATMTYDTDLDVNWIDFDPVFGSYNMDANITIEITGTYQEIVMLFIVYTEGKINQLNLNADIQYDGGNTANGIATLSFGYLEEYQDNILVTMDPIRTNGIARIPKGTKMPATINITVIPSQIPNNGKILLELTIDNQIGGKGTAVFDNINGSSTKEITGTTPVTIFGTTNSTIENNIILTANYKEKVLTSQNFSVRTWPTKLIRCNVSYDIPSSGKLYFEYNIESESGNTDDLKGIFLGEFVTYDVDPTIYFLFDWIIDIPSTHDRYVYPSPPYRIGPQNTKFSADDPTIIHKTIGVDVFVPKIPTYRDVHKLPTDGDDEYRLIHPGEAFRKPYEEHVYIGTQYYWFRDPLLMEQSVYKKIYGPNYIRRNIFLDVGVWTYRIEKIDEGHMEEQFYILP
jgi:hypothetical protein